MKIYTKQGDKGKTLIHGGRRVDKDDIRIIANGDLDELNSMLGVVRSFILENHSWQKILFKIQSEMMVIMSHVATPSDIRSQNPNILDESIVGFCEEEIDKLTKEMVDSRVFVLPGGTKISAYLHLARAISRRAERNLWTLNKIDELPKSILCFINRLSDLLFIMARYEMQQQNYTEEKWKEFQYKRKNKK